MVITAMMAIPLVQHLQNEHATVPVESYSYYNEMVKFVGQNAFVGFGYNIYPVSWTIFKENLLPQNSPNVNPFVSGGNASKPLTVESFTHYYVKRISNGNQNSAIMVEWNSNMRIAEIFTFQTGAIDASIAMKNLGNASGYMTAFSVSTKHHNNASINGLNPVAGNSKNGDIVIPGNDYQAYLGNLSVNWQSESSTFNLGIIKTTSSRDLMTLPFNAGLLSSNETYSIDPIIRSGPTPIIREPSPTPKPVAPSSHVNFQESGLPSGTSWSVSYNGQSYSSTSSEISLNAPNGEYSYSIGSVTGYLPSPSSGSVYTDYSTSTVNIGFTAVNYQATFTESGLPSGTSWSMAFNGETSSSTTSTISFGTIVGTHSYSIQSPIGYAASPSTGSVNINGQSQSVNVNFKQIRGAPTYPVQLSGLNITYYNIGQGIKKSEPLTHLTNQYCTGTDGISSWGVVQGGVTNVTISVNYHNASGLGCYRVTRNIFGYTISYPVYYGFLQIWSLNSAGGIQNLITTAEPKGNSTYSYTFQITPGVYGGFVACLSNRTSSAQVKQAGQFDVMTTTLIYSGSMTGANGARSLDYYECAIDAASSATVYNSTGSDLGTMTIALQGGRNSALTLNSESELNYETGFYSSSNDASTMGMHYGIFSYQQKVTMNENQIPGAYKPNKPYLKYNLKGIQPQANSNGQTTNLSEALYLGIAAALGIDPYTAVVGVALAAMYPFIFQGSPNSVSNTVQDNNLSCGETAQAVTLPNFTSECSPYSTYFRLIHTSNDNVSLIQNLQASMQLLGSPNNYQSPMQDLNFLTYTINAKIVPLVCIPTENGGTNSLVYATWHKTNSLQGYWLYDGPSYSVAVSEPLYFPQIGGPP
ncbi:MAG: hypothetical protein ACYCR7_03665 [Thermoplasmataceae archaeon]